MVTALREVLLFLDEAAALVGFVLVAGPLAFWATVARDGRYLRRQLLLVDVGVYVLGAAAVLLPVVLVTTGTPFGDVPRDTWASVLVRLAALAALVAWFPDLAAGPIVGPRRGWACLAVVVLSATFLAAPADAPGPRPWLVVVALLAHVVAAAVWLGGVVVLAASGLPMRDLDALSAEVGAFSRTTLACVVTVVVSSVVLVVGSSRADVVGLPSTGYGLVLVVKTVMFAVMVIVADHARRRVDAVLLHRLRTGSDSLPGIQAWSLLMGSQVAGAAVLVLGSVVLFRLGPPS
jgi:putative copper export protein